jgi:hypothetical protein
LLVDSFKADATRVVEAQTTTLAELGVVWDSKLECVNPGDGTVVCENRLVEIKDARSSTLFDTTYTGTPRPWLTIKNAGAAKPSDKGTGSTDDDDRGSGAARAWDFASAGWLLASVGTGLFIAFA